MNQGELFDSRKVNNQTELIEGATFRVRPIAMTFMDAVRWGSALEAGHAL